MARSVASRSRPAASATSPALCDDQVGQLAPDVPRPEVAQLAQRGGVEGAGLHAAGAEVAQPGAHLAGGPGGEGHGQHPLRDVDPAATPYAIREVIARVLPVPAPASTHSGPCSVVATSRCSGSSAASSVVGGRASAARAILAAGPDTSRRGGRGTAPRRVEREADRTGGVEDGDGA